MKSIAEHNKTTAQKNGSFFKGQGTTMTRFSASGIQPKLTIGAPNDKYEREADAMADKIMTMPNNDFMAPMPIQRKCSSCAEEERVQTMPLVMRTGNGSMEATALLSRQLNRSKGKGSQLPAHVNQHMSGAFGTDFSQVRVHTDSTSEQMNQGIQAKAFTHGSDVYFNKGQYNPNSANGKRLLAHELTHVVQQGDASVNTNPLIKKKELSIQRREIESDTERLHETLSEEYGGPQAPLGYQYTAEYAKRLAVRGTQSLSNREWELIEMWKQNGTVGIDPLTADADHNAKIIAASILCGRVLGDVVDETDSNKDPLFCVLTDVTLSDSRIPTLIRLVTARGPIINWTLTTIEERMIYIMERLIINYGYPVSGAAGLVGNLYEESGLLPNRIEGSRINSPMRASNFRGRMTDFTPDQVMNRDRRRRRGPRRPGIGLAQWTSSNRRSGLFNHQFNGRQGGSGILFNMNEQVDYLVNELQNLYARVNNVLISPTVTLNRASDEVVYNFEIPGSILSGGRKLPRNNARVQRVFRRRRRSGQRALNAYNNRQITP